MTAHDGFTLRDLVSYDHKHNEANLEENRDGTDDNRSWNCGAEGPTDDPDVLARRARQQRNLLATLLLSQGVPMLLGGDELGRTQHGNNNGWCHDDELSWFNWSPEAVDEELRAFTRRLIALRREEPALRRLSFLEGAPVERGALPDAWWFRPDGRRMTKANWDDGLARAVGLFLNGDAVGSHDEHGEPVRGRSLLLILSAAPDDVAFRLPSDRFGRRWEVLLDTAGPTGAGTGEVLAARSERTLPARSVLVLGRA
ncbi:MAG: hypothetical protein U0P45_13935 [Acidimicrobiales bacterium]